MKLVHPSRWSWPFSVFHLARATHWRPSTTENATESRPVAAEPGSQRVVRRTYHFDFHMPTMGWRKSAGAATLIVAGLVVGLLFSAQWQTKPVRSSVAPTESRQEVAIATIKQLEAEQADLKAAIGELRARIGTQQRESVTEQGSLLELSAELHRQQLMAGITPLQGRGVTVVLDDSAAKSIPPGEDPAMYIVHEYQLRDVVNHLWLAGAEAIAINGERIVNSTSIYCVGSTILVNDTRLSPPYQIVALGDPSTLEEAMQNPTNLTSLKGRVKTYGVQFSVSNGKSLTVPAYQGSVVIRHATIGSTIDSPAGAPQHSKSSEK